MNDQLPSKYLKGDEVCDKYRFLKRNTLKNLLSRNTNGFREKVVRKLGRLNLYDEEALLRFLNESK